MSDAAETVGQKDVRLIREITLRKLPSFARVRRILTEKLNRDS